MTTPIPPTNPSDLRLNELSRFALIRQLTREANVLAAPPASTGPDWEYDILDRDIPVILHGESVMLSLMGYESGIQFTDAYYSFHDKHLAAIRLAMWEDGYQYYRLRVIVNIIDFEILKIDVSPPREEDAYMGYKFIPAD